MAANILGPAIKALRKQRGWTQKQLSERTGIAQNTISNHENQNRTLDESDIKRYVKAFGVKPQTLYDYTTQSGSTDLVGEIQAMVIALHPDRQQNVFDFTVAQLQQQHKEAETSNDSVVKLQPKKSSAPDPFMPIAAHLDHELSDYERAEVDAWERKIAAEDDDDDEDDDN